MRKGLAMEMCVFKDCLVRKILWRECVNVCKTVLRERVLQLECECALVRQSREKDVAVLELG